VSGISAEIQIRIKLGQSQRYGIRASLMRGSIEKWFRA